MIAPGDVQDLIGRWWWTYDAGDFEGMEAMLAEDVHFTVRTDTGMTAFEEFVNADHRGREAVMAWQIPHRLDSPEPLRHMGQNVHLTADRGDEVDFASYIFVTHVVEGQIANLSTARVSGSVRKVDDDLRLAALHVVLDTATSTTLREARSEAS